MVQITLKIGPEHGGRSHERLAYAAEVLAAAQASFPSNDYVVTVAKDGGVTLDLSATADPIPHLPDEEVSGGGAADSERVGDVFSKLTASGVPVKKVIVAGETLKVIGDGAPEAWLKIVEQAACKVGLRTAAPRILEVGAGSGESTVLLSKSGRQAYVYSSSPYAAPEVQGIVAESVDAAWKANTTHLNFVYESGDAIDISTMTAQECDLIVASRFCGPFVRHCKAGGVMLMRFDPSELQKVQEFAAVYALGDPVIHESVPAIEFIRKSDYPAESPK